GVARDRNVGADGLDQTVADDDRAFLNRRAGHGYHRAALDRVCVAVEGRRPTDCRRKDRPDREDRERQRKGERERGIALHYWSRLLSYCLCYYEKDWQAVRRRTGN